MGECDEVSAGQNIDVLGETFARDAALKLQREEPIVGAR